MKTACLRKYFERLKDPFSGINDFVFPDLVKNIVSPPLEALITPLEKIYEVKDKESKNVKVSSLEVDNRYRKMMSLDFRDDKFIICFTLDREPTAFNLSLEKTMNDIFPDHQPSSREPGDIKELNVYWLPRRSSREEVDKIIKIDSSENQYSGQKCFSQRRSYSNGDSEWSRAIVDLNSMGYGKWKEFFTAVGYALEEMGLSDILKEQTNLMSIRKRLSIYTDDGLKQYRASEELAYELLEESRYSLSEGSPIHAEIFKLTIWSMQEDLKNKLEDLETARNYLSTQPSGEVYSCNDGRNLTFMVGTSEPDTSIVCYRDQHNSTAVAMFVQYGVQNIAIAEVSEIDPNNVEAIISSPELRMLFEIHDGIPHSVFYDDNLDNIRRWNGLMNNIETVPCCLEDDEFYKPKR